MFGDVPTAQLTLSVQEGITFNIFGKSKKAIKAAKSALLQLFDDESNVIALQAGKRIESKRLKKEQVRVCVCMCVYPSMRIHVTAYGPIGSKFGTHMHIHLERIVG